MIVLPKSLRWAIRAILAGLVLIGLYDMVLYSVRYIQHPMHYIGRIRHLDYNYGETNISMNDLEVIFDTYFDLGNQYWNIPSYVCKFHVFEDKDSYYFAPTRYTVFACADFKNAIQVSKHTGKIFNRFEERWVAYGYLCESIDTLKHMLNEKMTLNEVTHLLGRPYIMEILGGGLISLMYATEGGILRVEFKDGLFKEILFYDAVFV